MRHERMPEAVGVDANGCLTEHTEIDGQEIVVHYDDIPESDITLVHGMRCTTALRTMIDMAIDLDTSGSLAIAVDDCLRRGLFTIDAGLDRVRRKDMAQHRGAEILRALLEDRRRGRRLLPGQHR